MRRGGHNKAARPVVRGEARGESGLRIERTPMRALDLFRGAGGWSVACRDLGIAEDGVENMHEANETAYRNGLGAPVALDVWDLASAWLPEDHWDGLIASPPCQTFSLAGKGAGRLALETVLKIVASGDWANAAALRAHEADLGDPRTALVLTPLLFWHHMRPRWVALEQVPAVLPVWEAMADVMREAGYSVWTGNLHAEQYGVPQTRKRAILMAQRRTMFDDDGWADRPIGPPTPTHSRYYPRDKTRLDPGVLPWVSMAQALGWAMTDRPSPTVTGGGTDTGGAEPIAKWAERYESHPAFIQDRQLGQGRLERHGKPKDRTVAEPSYAMRGQASGSAPGGGYVLSIGDVRSSNGAVRDRDEPSPTLTASMDNGNFRASDGATSRRVTVEEAAALQSFPPDFVWCGGKGKQYLQVGNAIPPLLACAVLSALTGLS